jgi:hypothetical protein
LGAPAARADEADAKNMLKAMSDYLAAQKTISFDYDTNFEVVTKDHQKFLLASSGAAELNRPDKYRATRSGYPFTSPRQAESGMVRCGSPLRAFASRSVM